METVDLSRAVLVCNTFHFCFAAAKASLIPFLTLFCRMMGLSATETGIIMAIKTATGFIWAPLWSRCAIAYNKRRTVLMFSVFFMAATYLSLSVVFTQVKDQDISCAHNETRNNGLLMSNLPQNNSKPLLKESIETVTTLKTTTTTTLKTTSFSQESTTIISPTEKTTVNAPTVKSTTVIVNDQEPDDSDETPIDVIRKMLTVVGYPISYIKANNLTARQVYQIISEEYNVTDLKWDIFKEMWDPLLYPEDVSTDVGRTKRGVQATWTALKGKMSDLLSEIEERKMEVFVIVLVIIIFGEVFASPVEKVADDSWFDFLDRVDDLEKYGKQRLAGSIAFIILPVAVSVAVDYTECLLPFHIHHFFIHFYSYGAFLGLALLIAFFYPVPPPSKQKTKSKVMKGLQIVCCDCRGFLYIVTLLIMGIAYASVHTFLFWVIQDKGGSESNMGLCVTIGAVAEIPMLMFTGKMVNKIGNAGVVTVSLLAMTARTLYYSFLEIPWAVLPAELTHAFTHTAMWYAVLSYEEFNVGPGVDRSIRSILSSIYFGVGFSIGSLFSGLFYDLFGSSVMYWAGSALTGAWSIIFFVVSLCLPKKEKIKYVRLLRTEDTDSDADADDWLEMALKEQ